ncbi:Dihydrofolate synthase [Clostridiaceae bacterium JG1575]|nr:Dihydrofolate synthase [Clostridiaceae bacterium JG1575]
MMTYEEAMAFITGTQKFGQNLGLARMECMLKYLGNPERALQAIHIAGTNGKGSVAAIMSEALMKSGYRVGLYTSPYIEEFNERIQINRKNISNEDLARCTEKVAAAVKNCLDEGMEHPTEFEIITAVMFVYFKEEALDYCVIEVGLGGDLDSTNVVDPILSVITSISYDHMNVLGNTLGEIAKAKAGIIKKAPVISYPQREEAKQVLVAKAKATGAPLTFVLPQEVKLIHFREEEGIQEVAYHAGSWHFQASLRLLGIHQLMNSLLAVRALEALQQQGAQRLTPQKTAAALSVVRWMGRFEILSRDPLVIIDGAHNVDGIRQLKRSLDFYYPHRRYVLILGILADKETHEMADLIARDARSVICVTPNSVRASLAKDLYDYIVSFNDHVTWEESYPKALELALDEMEDGDLIIASGSLYMVGDLRRVMRARFSVPYDN